MKDLRNVNALNSGTTSYNKYSGGSSRRVFRAELFSKNVPEATEEFYPDSPMELERDVLEGNKKIYLTTK